MPGASRWRPPSRSARWKGGAARVRSRRGRYHRAGERRRRVGIVVQKFGGSSVADVERIGRVADRVAATRASGKDVVVVVSAMGDTTDELLALANRVTENPSRRELDMLLSA